jgi:hypothetical protein
MTAAAARRRGGYCRAIMVNPLMRGLPKLAIMLQVTCNAFKAEHVRHQWRRIAALWNRSGGLAEILGPLVGHASDGDARREKLMLQDMLGGGPGGRFSIPWEGLTMAGAVGPDGTVSGVHSQDTIHNAKKMLNPLDQTSRLLQMGPHQATWEVIILERSKVRSEVGSRLCFPRLSVRTCLGSTSREPRGTRPRASTTFGSRTSSERTGRISRWSSARARHVRGPLSRRGAPGRTRMSRAPSLGSRSSTSTCSRSSGAR